MFDSILFSEMVPLAGCDRPFNDWYSMEFTPIRMSRNGIRFARIYKETDCSKYVTVYEMDNVKVMQPEIHHDIEKQGISITSIKEYTCDKIGDHTKTGFEPYPLEAPYLFVVTFKVPEVREDEFNEWYDTDHIPILLKNEHWAACRRFRHSHAEPGEWTHLAIHYLYDWQALQSKEWEQSRTPWLKKLAQEEWFKATFIKLERIGTLSPEIAAE